MIYVILATTKQRRERLVKCVKAIRESTIPHCLVIYENADGGHVLATKKAISGINGEMFLLNDDMIVTPTCLERLKIAFDKHFPLKDGVCQPYENLAAGNCPHSPFCHTDTIRPFLEDYIHYGWDSEFGAVMKMKKKFVTVRDAVLDHQHYSKTPGIELDETYRINALRRNQDAALFYARKAQGFKHRFP